jgi:hypothetical protein
MTTWAAFVESDGGKLQQWNERQPIADGEARGAFVAQSTGAPTSAGGIASPKIRAAFSG